MCGRNVTGCERRASPPADNRHQPSHENFPHPQRPRPRSSPPRCWRRGGSISTWRRRPRKPRGRGLRGLGSVPPTTPSIAPRFPIPRSSSSSAARRRSAWAGETLRMLPGGGLFLRAGHCPEDHHRRRRSAGQVFRRLYRAAHGAAAAAVRCWRREAWCGCSPPATFNGSLTI